MKSRTPTDKYDGFFDYLKSRYWFSQNWSKYYIFSHTCCMYSRWGIDHETCFPHLYGVIETLVEVGRNEKIISLFQVNKIPPISVLNLFSKDVFFLKDHLVKPDNVRHMIIFRDWFPRSIMYAPSQKTINGSWLYQNTSRWAERVHEMRI